MKDRIAMLQHAREVVEIGQKVNRRTSFSHYLLVSERSPMAAKLSQFRTNSDDRVFCNFH